MTDKKLDPYTADELKALLTDRVRQYYDNAAQLDEVPDPGRLVAALIEAIAETWGENNRRIMDYSRRTGFGGGKRF